MKALSIREPWASLIASGEKTIETRTWKTDYRGRLLLCASKNPEGKYSGKAFAVADLVEISTMPYPVRELVADSLWAAACCKPYSGAYGWDLLNVTLIEPFSVKGRLGLFNVQFPVPFCQCPTEGVMPSDIPERWWDSVTELPFVNHAPGQCKCTNDLRQYIRGGRIITLCSNCTLGDVEVGADKLKSLSVF